MTSAFTSVVRLLPLILALVLGSTNVACQSDSLSPGKPSFTLGVCTHFVQRKGLLEENLRLIRAAGFTSIRDEVPWAVVEVVQGSYQVPERVDAYVDAALAAGLQPVLVLDYGNRYYEKGMKPKAPESVDGFVRYASFIATHFKGRVRQYEVWNEWDIGIGTATGERGTPDRYMALLKPTYAALKQIDPQATVVGGVVSPFGLGSGFFEELVSLGLVKHCDAVSIHPYLYAATPQHRASPEALMERLHHFNELLTSSNDGVPVPLLITELGWPNNSGPSGSSPKRTADMLARTHLLARSIPNLEGIWWYDFQDDGWKPAYNEDNFGLVRPDLTPKPAYFAVQGLAELLKEGTYLGQLEIEIPEASKVIEPSTSSSAPQATQLPGAMDSSPPSTQPRPPVSTQPDAPQLLHIHRFRLPGGQTVLAGWATPRPVTVRFESQQLTMDDSVTVTLVGHPPLKRRWMHRHWVGQPKNQPEPALAVTFHETPILIELPPTADISSATAR